MALHHPLSLRRALSLSVSLLHRSLHGPKPIASHLLPTPRPTPTPTPIPTPTVSFTQLARPFTSTTALFRKAFDPETDEIGPDTILFEGCDYKHWLITMDFRDSNLTRDQMIDTYVNTAAQVFGSIEEAKKKIYALSTTTYQGFQVECSEETSEKFKGIPGVVFVLPDSYIDPANKEYGGDKYINGEIIPRPPPVHYARHNRNRPRPSEQNYGPPRQQNYGPGPQQNYGPGPQQNYRPAPQQNYGPAPQQNYRPAPQQNYRPAPAQNYGPPPAQNYGLPPAQNYGLPPAQNYGPPPSQNNGPTPQQNYGPTPVPNYGQLPQNQGPPPQQNYAPPPQQNYTPPPQQNYRPVQQQGYTPQPHQSYESPPQQGYVPRMQRGNYLNSPNNASGRDERNYAHGQGDLQSHVPSEQRGFSEDGSYGSSQGGSFEQSGERRNF